MNAEIVAMPTKADDAEISLLGAAMSGAPDLDDLLDLVAPADFYDPRRGEVWSAIGRVHHEGIQPDMVAVRAAVEEAKVGIDPAQLFHWVQMVPIIAQAAYYAEQVTTAAGLRRIQIAGTQLQQIASRPGNLDERQEEARQAVDDACQGRNLTRARMVADLVDDVLEIAETGGDQALSTPWPDLDRLIGGMGPGRLIVIGARPGVGKSLAGTNLALHMAERHKHAVLIASMEMPEREVMQRLLASYAQVGLTGIQTGNVPESEWGRIGQKHADLRGLPIAVEDRPDQSVTSMRAAARNVQRTRDDLALIVVDYLQLMKTAATDNRAQALGEVSRGLKLLARETGACVVAMAQVNRDSAKAGVAPRSSDLRESGSIEADADQVILMHQPDESLPELELIVDKNRHGARGLAHLQVAGHYAQLRSIAWSPSSQTEGKR